MAFSTRRAFYLQLFFERVHDSGSRHRCPPSLNGRCLLSTCCRIYTLSSVTLTVSYHLPRDGSSVKCFSHFRNSQCESSNGPPFAVCCKKCIRTTFSLRGSQCERKSLRIEHRAQSGKRKVRGGRGRGICTEECGEEINTSFPFSRMC